MFWGKNADRCPTSEQENAKVEELFFALGPLSGPAKLFCSDACLKRYLRARNWSVQKAKSMLEETLKWRALYKPEHIKWEEVSVEAETGKMYRASFSDLHGRPVILMIPGNQNTNSHDGQLRHLVYCMENATIHLPPNQEQFVWIIDFMGWSVSKATPIRTARETAHILQNHYPERLALGIFLNPPKVFEFFWKLWRPFIDPETFQKARFVYTSDADSLRTLDGVFDKESVKFEFAGQYNHREYSQKMQEDDIKMASYWMQVDPCSDSMNGMDDEKTPKHTA